MPRHRAQAALEDERTARVEAEALAARLRAQLSGLREAQSSQQRSAQERLSALQAHLQSLAARVVRFTESPLPTFCEILHTLTHSLLGAAGPCNRRCQAIRGPCSQRP
jgi:hypothetical protein